MLALVLSLLHPIHASGETVALSVEQLGTALASIEEEADAIRRLILDDIQQRLDVANLAFLQGDLIFRHERFNEVVADGCNRTTIRQMLTTIALKSDTNIGLTLNSLHDPVVLTFDLLADVSAVGRAQQIIGFSLDGCRQIASDSFDFSAWGPVRLALSVSLNLNPVFINNKVLRLQPEIVLEGELREWHVRVDVDDSLARVVLEAIIKSEINDAFNPHRVLTEIELLNEDLNSQLTIAIPDGYIDVELPDPDNQQIMALYQLLAPDARFPLTLEYLSRHSNEILAALLLDEGEAITAILENAAICQAATILTVDLPRKPLYTVADNLCTTTQYHPDIDQSYFTDDVCENPIGLVDTSMSDFCEVVLNPQRLGNAAVDIASLDQWGFSPGNTFDLGVLSIVGTSQPYMQRRSYKTVQTARGECQLEMRVYTSHLAVQPQQPQRPLMALHGGSWQHRANGFLGIEAMAAHFTQSGFVVFAPFYRLIGVEDGNDACNDATLDDALSDAEAALDWVLDFGEAFGTSGKPTLFGQSAGGHLAAALAVNRASQIKQAVLFYAPTDFADFAEQIINGSYTGTQGRRIMEAVIGTDIESLSLDDPLIQNNTFPSIIAAQPDAYPPFFLLHGGADDLLPYRQSVRLCSALSGNPESAAQTDGLMAGLSNARDVIHCDARGSQLHLLKEGDHALDFCIAPELCNAGSEESARLVADSVQQMLDWINPPPAPLNDSAEDGIERLAAGVMDATLLAFLLMITFVRLHNSAQKRRGFPG